MTTDYDGNIDFTQDAPPVSLSLVPCSTCGRTFNEKALSKHAPICAKASKNAAKRGTFSASKKRVDGLEVKPKDAPSSTPLKPKKRTAAKPSRAAAQPSSTPSSSAKKAAWRAKHEEFIANIRAARKVTAVLNAGGTVADLPPPAPSENPDYVQCPTCSRRFNEDAAKRHMPFCAEKAKREAMKQKNTNSKADAVKKRTSYKPPLPRSRTSSNMTTAKPDRARQTPNPTSHHASASEDDRPIRSAKPPAGSASAHRIVRRSASPRVRRTNGTAAAADKLHRTSSYGSRLNTARAHHSSFEEGSESSMSPSPTPNPSYDAMASSGYPFDRERPNLDDAMIDNRSRHRNGSASSTGKGSLRIGSAARPKYCCSCGESLLSGPKRFCSECGERFDNERGKFCSNCGTRR
eukprot:TRINITY_DN11225_c0_g1_i2.p1 TRINITY_DN11225_c0_g1~~TRINITY_DN11225_c0_g1_i2.p1  ORF type:complete len:406 (+),score=60.81 TRINITY_DN11225_c0_g1_i2:71-1288(+)